jgi:hypothetical protein
MQYSVKLCDNFAATNPNPNFTLTHTHERERERLIKHKAQNEE